MRQILSVSILLTALIFFSFIMDHIAHAFSFNAGSLFITERDFEIRDDFTVTAYCPGKCCNGKWAGMTAKGKTMDYYIKKGIKIIAVDPDIIPFDSIIIYNNTRYLAVDAGSKIKGNRLDVLFMTHDETIEFGVKRKQLIKIIRQ